MMLIGAWRRSDPIERVVVGIIAVTGGFVVLLLAAMMVDAANYARTAPVNEHVTIAKVWTESNTAGGYSAGNGVVVPVTTSTTYYATTDRGETYTATRAVWGPLSEGTRACLVVKRQHAIGRCDR